MDVGGGDYVKIAGVWKRIASNTAQGATITPRSWTVTTEDGNVYGMYSIERYAKAEDVE